MSTGSFPEVKRSRSEVNHSPPSSAEVKNEWSYTPTPLYVFMVWTGKTLPSAFTCKQIGVTYQTYVIGCTPLHVDRMHNVTFTHTIMFITNYTVGRERTAVTAMADKNDKTEDWQWN